MNLYIFAIIIIIIIIFIVIVIVIINETYHTIKRQYERIKNF